MLFSFFSLLLLLLWLGVGQLEAVVGWGVALPGIASGHHPLAITFFFPRRSARSMELPEDVQKRAEMILARFAKVKLSYVQQSTGPLAPLRAIFAIDLVRGGLFSVLIF